MLLAFDKAKETQEKLTAGYLNTMVFSSTLILLDKFI